MPPCLVKREQVGYTLHAVDECGVELGTRAYKGARRLPAEPTRDEGKDHARKEKKGQQHKSKGEVKQAEKQARKSGHEDGSHGWHDNAHVEVVQGFDIAHDARQQIAA